MKLHYKIILGVLFSEFVLGYYLVKKLYQRYQQRKEVLVPGLIYEQQFNELLYRSIVCNEDLVESAISQ